MNFKIIHRKKIALGANDRKEIEKLLEGMLKSEELLNISDSEFAGVLIEEKKEIVREIAKSVRTCVQKMKIV